MRHLLCSLLLVYGGVASAQVDSPEASALAGLDPDLMQGGPAWLVGDHVKARRHFRAAAQRGHQLGRYNLAMMLLHHEGGPCGSAEAIALLRQAAEGGSGLARETLGQIQDGGTPPQGIKHPFPCSLPSPVRSTRVAGPVQPAAAR